MGMNIRFSARILGMQVYPMETKVRAVMEYVAHAGRTHLQIGLAYDIPNRAISDWCRNERVIVEVAHVLMETPQSVRGKIKSKSEAAKQNGREKYKTRFIF